MHFRLSLNIEANCMSHHQTAPKGVYVLLREQSDLGPHCLQFRLPKSMSKQIKNFLNGGKRVNIMPCDIALNKDMKHKHTRFYQQFN